MGRGGGAQVGVRGQVGCERIEVFVKIQKKKNFFFLGGGGGGGGVDVNEELKLLRKFPKKMGGGVGGRGYGFGGGGVRVDVNEELKIL